MTDVRKVLQIEINSDGSSTILRDDGFVVRIPEENIKDTMAIVSVKLAIPIDFLKNFVPEDTKIANSPLKPVNVGIAIFVPDEEEERSADVPSNDAYKDNFVTLKSVLPKAKYKGRECYYDGTGDLECTPPL